jgi:hypothetical protein
MATAVPGLLLVQLYQVPRSWAEEAYPKLIHYNQVEKGGHFAAWEQPELLAEEVRTDRNLQRREPQAGTNCPVYQGQPLPRRRTGAPAVGGRPDPQPICSASSTMIPSGPRT